MSTWIKIKGTQGGNFQLGFTGPLLQNASGNLEVKNGANTSFVSLTAGNITASEGIFVGNAAGLTNIVAANIVGQVANALVADTVTSSSQPNITSLGTLANLSVSGNANVTGNISTGGILTDNYYYANGAPVDFQQAGGDNTQVQFNSSGSFGASANFTFNTDTNTLFATNLSGNGALLTSITAANITGQVANALIAETVTSNAQPNITSVGTLTNLDVQGNVLVGGNLTVNGNLTYINVDTLSVKDPIIQLQSSNGGPLTSNTNYDVGTALNYWNTAGNAGATAFMGWDTSNSEFAFGSQVSINNEVVNWTTLGNVRADTFIGNLSGTILTNAQTNITSVGTLTGLTVDGVANLGPVSNVKISGGNAGEFLSTDGNGNLSWSAPQPVGMMTVVSTPFVVSSNATISAFTLPANAIVDTVSIIVDSAFSGGTGATITVGPQGIPTQFAGAGDSDLTTVGRYDVPSSVGPVGTPINVELYYTAAGASGGSGRVLITYALPI
jgi:hypothetical protein